MSQEKDRTPVFVIGCLIAFVLALAGALGLGWALWRGYQNDQRALEMDERRRAQAAASGSGTAEAPSTTPSPSPPNEPGTASTSASTGSTAPDADPSSAPDEPLPVPSSSARPADPPASYFLDATSIPPAYQAKIGGPVRVTELALYPRYAFVTVQDPKKKENLDQYEIRDGIVAGGQPVRVPGRVDKQIEAKLFDLMAVDVTIVPKMAADALAQLRLEDGKVTHMILRKDRPFGNDLRWRVYVVSPRKSGSVEYGANGQRKKVWD